MANANDSNRPATLTVRLDQFPTLEAFARGYRQHVSRTQIYLPTRVPRAEGSLLLFRIELADGTCAFRGEGVVESFRHTPGGEQLGLTLRLQRLDKASKDLHTAVFAGAVETRAVPAPAPAQTPPPPLDDLAAAIGAAAEEALDAMQQPAPSPAREAAVVARSEGDAPARIRDDLRPVAKGAPEAGHRVSEASPEADPTEQAQALGRMAVARMSVDEYEARKAAMARAAAPPPVASLTASSESTAAWSEADDALDFEGLGSDIRENVPVADAAPPAPVVVHEEEPAPPAPTLPPLESIVVAPPEEAVGGGVAVAEVTFAGSAAYEMPKSAPLEEAKDLDLDFDFTAVSFTEEESLAKGLSGSRPAVTSSAVTAARPAASVVTTPSSAVSNAVTRPVETVERPVPAAPAPVPTAPAVAPGPSRLPPAPPPKSGASAPPAAGGAPGARPAVPMSKPIPKPTAPSEEEKPGLFGWLRGKK